MTNELTQTEKTILAILYRIDKDKNWLEQFPAEIKKLQKNGLIDERMVLTHEGIHEYKQAYMDEHYDELLEKYGQQFLDETADDFHIGEFYKRDEFERQFERGVFSPLGWVYAARRGYDYCPEPEMVHGAPNYGEFDPNAEYIGWDKEDRLVSISEDYLSEYLHEVVDRAEFEDYLGNFVL